MDFFLWLLFSYYIFIGTCQVLLMKASAKSAGGTNKAVAYNTASAMMLIEFTKCLVCLVIENLQGDAARKEKGESRKSSTCRGFLFYAIPGFLYAVENNLKIPATVFLHPHVFALFNNSKVVFAAIGMVLLLGKRFSVLQWVSMSLLVMSLCVAEVRMLLPAPTPCNKAADDGMTNRTRRAKAVTSEDVPFRAVLSTEESATFFGNEAPFVSIALSASAANILPMLKEAWAKIEEHPTIAVGTTAQELLPAGHHRFLNGLPGASSGPAPPADDTGLFLLGLGLAFAASVISGLAGVFNELLLKKRDSDVSLWRKNIWTYQWGMIFNSVGFVSSIHFGSSNEQQSGNSFAGLSILDHVFRGYDVWVWAMIFVTALLGISVSMIMKYFDNVVKCFGGSLILYTTTVASMFFFGSKVDAGFVLGLAVYSVSSYFYAGDHNKRLETYEQYHDEIEAFVKGKKQRGEELVQLTRVNVDETDDKFGTQNPSCMMGKPSSK